jgi:hypothetical protein
MREQGRAPMNNDEAKGQATEAETPASANSCRLGGATMNQERRTKNEFTSERSMSPRST